MESRIQECLGFLTWNETYRGAHERWRVDHIVKALLICIKRVLSITVRDILVSAGIIFRFIIRLFVLILILIPSRFIKNIGKQQIFSILLGKITCKTENCEFTSLYGRCP